MRNEYASFKLALHPAYTSRNTISLKNINQPVRVLSKSPAEREGIITELPRYSDKYRPIPSARPALKKKELHQPFFPQQIFDDYFNPKSKRKSETYLNANSQR